MGRAFPGRFPVILGEGSMYERLRRGAADTFDPHIAYAGMLYDDTGREVLAATHREYLDIGQRHGLPMVAGTPTWRTSADRIARSRFAAEPVNADGCAFMKELRAAYGPGAAPILIAAITGPAGDGYKPEEAPDEDGAMRFHAPQIAALADSGVDLFKVQTLPAFGEARGIARLLAETEVPYVLSFVIRADGTLLDGTPLDRATAAIDDAVPRPPEGYNINCVHASVFASAMGTVRARDPAAAERVLGIDANTSAKTPEELDGLDEIDTEAPRDFGRNVFALRAVFGTRYLGGCCGSTTEHMAELARRCAGVDAG
ncbi:homocysteine S-methyltransferase family protein [Aestuariicoccus sp. MJ-SS9]|uniref:homocysteine S-methyltransferase family protein n=1 Tax=Aestuariicoccus sp. MJ-SS9 TaxID=3079855 RepID=UPI0029131774|nr:homocysteine S-methyltransferase family protein [Aestuariicoccus sp. MJ-SS9]MDU8909910.1 homocysteine S-methyltransferase family protein [Aestuariicoccus sp. MJ-SS9]